MAVKKHLKFTNRASNFISLQPNLEMVKVKTISRERSHDNAIAMVIVCAEI